jgi:hypothetical protein
VSINVNYSESDTTEQFLNDTLYQTTKDTIFWFFPAYELILY